MCGAPRYIDSAQKAVACASSALAGAPAQCASLLHAHEELRRPPRVVVIRADEHHAAAWRAAAYRQFDPSQLTFVIPPATENLPEALAVRRAAGAGVAYVCEGAQCQTPATTPDNLARQLARGRAGENMPPANKS